MCATKGPDKKDVIAAAHVDEGKALGKSATDGDTIVYGELDTSVRRPVLGEKITTGRIGGWDLIHGPPERTHGMSGMAIHGADGKIVGIYSFHEVLPKPT
eukprot:GHVP01056026.1.p3 GENE.GHVP01056026.1~~GHVP01056026.1.p3  ORF type:complete len:100 (-),score=12.81 GHVP01056026.1:79-378(-)